MNHHVSVPAPLRTPLLMLDERISLKAENLQPFGSYKIRGVSRAIRQADPETLRLGLSAASAGNMAQPVAAFARTLKLSCRIYLPDTAPPVKKGAIRRLGAQLVELPFREVWSLVQEGRPSQDLGLFFHPTRTPGLTEGYGEIVDEILVDLPETDAIVVPFGVGGLSLGVVRRLRELGSRAAVYTCEPETAAPMFASMRTRKPLKVDRRSSFVDAIGTPEVLPEVFELLVPMLAGSLAVSLEEIRKAMGTLLFEKKLVCEGAGAAALAGALKLAETSEHKKIVALLTGGNVTPTVLRELVF